MTFKLVAGKNPRGALTPAEVEHIADLYVREGLSVRSIIARTGHPHCKVSKALKDKGINTVADRGHKRRYYEEEA